MGITAVQVSETMAASNNGHLPNSLDDGEDKPMLIVKKTGDGPGITALINRQLQGTLIEIMMDLIDVNVKSCYCNICNEILSCNQLHWSRIKF
jgi:hypothetical protein